MSVINKMLRDLDKRGGLGPRNLEEGMKDIERVPLPAEEAEPRPWGKISAAVIVVALVATVGWYFLQPSAPATVARKGEPAKPLQLAKAPAPVVEAPKAATPQPAPTPVVEVPKAATPQPAPVEAKPAPSTGGPAGIVELTAAAKSAAKAQETGNAAMSAAVVNAAPKRVPAESRPAVVAAVEAPPKAAAQAPPMAPTQAPPKAAEPKAASADAAQGRISVERGDRTLTGPARADLEYRNGNDQVNQGKVEAALAKYTEALRFDSRHVRARQALVVLLLEQGNSTEAQAALREGISVVPQNVSWPMLLARLQIDAGDAKSALETLERSLPGAGAQPEYLAFLATVLQMQSRHADAIRHYQASIQLAPDSGRSLTGLAISLEAEKRLPEAREAYRRALATTGLGRDLEAFAERRLKQLQ